MMHEQPTVSDYMTPSPATVHHDLRLADAMDRMYDSNFRHLPVVDDDGQLMGMVSTRDIAVATSIDGVDPEKTPIKRLIAKRPLSCGPDTPLADVLAEMERNRFGSVVVTENGKPTGVFTTTDALRALRSSLAGKPVEALVEPRHEISSHDESARTTTRAHPRARGVNKYDGMVPWFLAKL